MVKIMDAPISTEDTAPEAAAQPKSEPIVNLRALRPQLPLQGMRKVIPAKPPYDPKAEKGLIYIWNETKIWNGDELLVHSPRLHWLVGTADPAMRSTIFDAFRDLAQRDWTDARTKVYNWSNEGKVTTKPVISEVGDAPTVEDLLGGIKPQPYTTPAARPEIVTPRT